MSIDDLKRFKPDTPTEWSFIGSSIARLGTAMSGVLLFTTDKAWVIGSMVLTWIGHEISQYFKIEQTNKEESK